MNSKAQSTKYARDKAQQLLTRAIKITVDTNNKMKEIKGNLFFKNIIHIQNLMMIFLCTEMVNITSSNDAELSEMEQKILRLNGEIDAYIQRIRDHADRYRTCTS